MDAWKSITCIGFQNFCIFLSFTRVLDNHQCSVGSVKFNLMVLSFISFVILLFGYRNKIEMSSVFSWKVHLPVVAKQRFTVCLEILHKLFNMLHWCVWQRADYKPKLCNTHIQKYKNNLQLFMMYFISLHLLFHCPTLVIARVKR